jgi:hypothetical protein
MRSILNTRSIAASAVILLAACGGDLPTSANQPSPSSFGDEGLAASFDEMSLGAASLGDQASAEAYADGALAIRLGAVPTEIAVKVAGQDYRYWAVITGIVERGPDGAELLKRSLVAWTGAPRPTAVLKAIARSDAAVFGRDDIPGDPGRAIGSWNDLERHHRFIAIDGSFGSVLHNIGPSCPNAERDTRFSCNLARFDVRMDGTFELAGDATVRLPIATAPDGVSGVVVRRTDGGSGGRPTATPSRPMPTRGVTPTRG